MNFYSEIRYYLTSFATVVIVIALISLAAFFPAGFQGVLDAIKTQVVGHFGFIFTWPAFFASLVLVVLSLTPLGRVKFGQGEPEFSTLSWLGMLFATGMGIGLLTWGTLEPHQLVNEGYSRDQALVHSFNQWGLLAWAGYLAIGAIFAHAFYNMNITKPAETLLGDGLLSKLNLISLVVSTVIGLALSFSYATTPIKQGLQSWLGTDVNAPVIISVLALFAIASSTSGLQRGIKWLSNYNTLFCLLLMLSVFVLTVPWDILQSFTRLVPSYLVHYPAMATATGWGDPEHQAWLANWLYAFEAAWYGWFIFTGVFIARISKGRTLRQMTLGVMIVPSLFSCLWFVVFGLGGLDQNADSVFALINAIDATKLLSVLLTVCILLFFVTSADSAGLVCEMLTVKGSRAFWIASMAALAMVISMLGGNVYKTLLTLISVAALPVAVGIFAIVIAFFVRLRQDHAVSSARAAPPVADGDRDTPE